MSTSPLKVPKTAAFAQEKPKKVFGAIRDALDLPYLTEVQLASYRWFLEKGLRELFDEISPIKDFSGKMFSLVFGDYFLDTPKYDEKTAKERNATYEAPLFCKVTMENHVTGKSKSQDVYLGDFPLMTKRGTFVINGVERVVVSQLMKSPGVFFTANSVRGRNFYGAKIIPNRGAWIEFDTDQQGVIGVKIDRKRRISATALLRMFGLARNEDITQAFTDIDTDANSNYIKATIDKDPTHTQEEGYIEIYKRIRPGDLATIDNAKQLLDAVFFQQERYDLSEVGRYKLNQRLGRDAKVTNRLLQLEDLVGTIREIIRLNNTQQPSDDIDHLANRRIRAVGELIQARMRVGLMRMARIGRDRMSLADPQTVAPAQLIHVRPIVAVIQEFFSSSQLSQFMDQTNPLAELEHKRRLSAMGPGGLSRERAGFEVRDVHRSHYGRLCPITTPEGPNIGLISHLATYARVNEYGFLETPYRKVESKNGRMRVTDDIEYLDAFEEEQVVIAQASTPVDENGYFLVDKVQVRVRGEPSVADVADIEYMDVSPKQIVSVTTSLIPFLEHNDSNRALMGSNMQRQAVPLIKPEAPLVGTGVEARAARDSGQMVIAETDGTVVSVAADEIVIQHSKGTKHSHPLQKFIRSNSSTSINQHPIVRKGQRVKKGDPIADGPAMDNGELALGQNLLVAFMSWEGGNYEDAILISERVVQQDRFSSIHIEDYHVDVRETKLGPEVVTRDIPNVGEEKLRNLDENGIVRIGAEVRAGDILVGKITPKGETELTPEERLLRVIFGEKARDVKDTSLLLPHGEYGKVVAIRDFSREQGDKLPAGVIKSYQISVAVTRKLQVGDKMAGRHGNKGVISKIVPVEDMPYLENGTPVDIILSPLGVASRMNLGQILETHLGMAAAQMQFRTASPALAGATEEEIKKELLQAQLSESGKVWVRDGKTGARFDEPVTVGCIYMMKLHHLVDDKMHARSTGPYSLITQQPLGGKAQFGGQRFGEMEVWALEGYGAAHTLQEMLTIKSDDVMGRSKTYESIVKGEAIKKPNIPESFKVLVKELQGLGLEVELIGEERTEASEEKAPEGKGEIAEKESESTEKVMLTEKTEA